MRLQETELAPETLRMVLEVLAGDPSSGDIWHGGSLLYLCSNRAEFARQMPLFDKWGLRPAGLAGPRENPVAMAPFLAASTDLAPGAGAGRQASLEAGGSGVVVPTPHGVPEASSSGACEARPEAVVDGGTQPAAPEVGAPKASAGHQEVVPDRSSQLGALRLAAWVLLHPRLTLVRTSSAWVGSAWTSPPSVRGRSLRVAVGTPSDR